MALRLGCQVRGEGPASPTCCHLAALAGKSQPDCGLRGRRVLAFLGLASHAREGTEQISGLWGVRCDVLSTACQGDPGAGLCLPVLCRKRVPRGDHVLRGRVGLPGVGEVCGLLCVGDWAVPLSCACRNLCPCRARAVMTQWCCPKATVFSPCPLAPLGGHQGRFQGMS